MLNIWNNKIMQNKTKRIIFQNLKIKFFLSKNQPLGELFEKTFYDWYLRF